MATSMLLAPSLAIPYPSAARRTATLCLRQTAALLVAAAIPTWGSTDKVAANASISGAATGIGATTTQAMSNGLREAICCLAHTGMAHGTASIACASAHGISATGTWCRLVHRAY